MDALSYIKLFKYSPSWFRMTQTVEASPWHREANVAVHTEMVLDQYKTRFMHLRTPTQNRVALLALLFHDVGKPAAEEVLEKKDGSGTYRRYAGHEQDSAVAFTERWLQDPILREMVSVEEARQIRWIIEHHLPYSYKDAQKRQDLRTAVAHTLRENEETFYDCLRSDAAGRISDDHETKLQNVEDWIAEFRELPLTVTKYDPSKGKCFILIGPSGSGKSTWVRTYKDEHGYVFSRDMLYAQYWRDKNGPSGKPFIDAKTEYADAWRLCCIDDKVGFEAYLRSRLDHLFKTSLKGLKAQPFRSVFIDNTNGSKKARAQYVQLARSLEMKVVAVEFWNSFETLVERQSVRPDKEVPASSVKQQYYAQTCAWLGSEADEVIVVPGI